MTDDSEGTVVKHEIWSLAFKFNWLCHFLAGVSSLSFSFLSSKQANTTYLRGR